MFVCVADAGLVERRERVRVVTGTHGRFCCGWFRLVPWIVWGVLDDGVMVRRCKQRTRTALPTPWMCARPKACKALPMVGEADICAAQAHGTLAL